MKIQKVQIKIIAQDDETVTVKLYGCDEERSWLEHEIMIIKDLFREIEG